MKKLLYIFTLVAALLFSGSLLAQSPETTTPCTGSSVSVSPSPFDTELTITIQDCPNKKVVSITIYDIIAAKEVVMIDLRNKTGLLTYRLDTSKLKPGAYFYTVYGENGTIETRRLFKAHNID